MNTLAKRFVLGACFIVMLCAEIVPGSALKVGFFRDAEAVIGVAPGGSVARRHAVVGAEVATTAVVASSSANASAAAAANANAAAAASKPPPPPHAATPAGPPPVGSIVTTLPPGCTTTVLNGVEYFRCGSSYYRATMMGSNLVFVVQQP
jgi:hypothetical protein